MKLPPIAYAAPTSVDEAVALLAEDPGGSAVLAGGQSLLLELRYGDAAPRRLVDLNRVAGLGRLSVDGGDLRVGALVRHAALEHLPVDLPAGPLGRLLRAVAPAVAHPPIRTRGTFAGSLAWAHPCAEWCALAVLTDAQVQVQGTDAARAVAARDWFAGERRSVRRPDEVVTEVRVPLLPDGAGVGFVEHRRTHASFALVAALAAVVLDDAGRIGEARLALAGASGRPVRASAAEQALVGAEPSAPVLAAVADAAGEVADRPDERHCSADYRRHAVRVVARRALEQAVSDARRRAHGEQSA